MTLDVTAYKQLSKSDDVTWDTDDDALPFRDADGREIEDGDSKYVYIEYGDYEQQHPELLEGLSGEGVYSFTDMDDSFGMSYPGVMSWNKHLKRMCEDHKIDIASFMPHIGHGSFAGPVMAARLVTTFTQHRSSAEQYAARMVEDGEWWLRKYDQWTAVYTFASDDGAVHYH